MFLDLTAFIELIPTSKAYLLTALATTWGPGNARQYATWPLIATIFCAEDATYLRFNWTQNIGWRCQSFAIGRACLAIAGVRTFILKLDESPKWIASRGQLDQAVSNIAEISRSNKSHFRVLANDPRAVPLDRPLV